MRLRLVILLAAAASLVACTQATQPTPKTDDDKVLYSLGVLMARRLNVSTFDLTDKEWEMVKAGLIAGTRNKEALEDEEMEGLMPKLQELEKTRLDAATTREKDAGAAYLTKAAAEPGATKLDSGVVYKSVQEGTGASPTASDTVKVNYEGRFVDGEVFDSSIKRNEPYETPLNYVVPCWTEAVQLMKVGGKAQLVCPPETAYGDQAQPGMRGGATLIFDVELLDILPPADEAAAASAP